ncbi:polysaccharide biosynthesis protein [Clostridium sp. LY3-2]|uniref:polysaccharide biosynthesis protein n=1 Tax=Clostridium sp. LY3-2 TaxID=2942482 RepID=UPI002153A0A3|nr:nucleoside-diphosphate sugar epimerase/dehydratase [Clostridium sp. LY3-2]MCR6513722.1 polysaccharide biosynthesis protein [Clostridium sp. LY3-2]
MDKIRKIRVPILIIADIIFINLAFIFGFIVRFDFDVPKEYIASYFKLVPIFTIIYIVFLYIFKMYRTLWSNASIDEFVKGLFACIIAGTTTVILNNILSTRIPNSIVILSSALIYLMVVGLRLSYRIYRRLAIYGSVKVKKASQRVLVIGAGACGHMVINEMYKNKQINMRPVAIIDDDKNKLGKFLQGVEIVGNKNDIENVVEDLNIDTIIIAISSTSAKNKKEIIEECQKTSANIKIIPGVYEIMGGKISLSKMRDVDLKDLLGREEVELDKIGVSSYLEGKTVLVTGGGGSIGSELCRQIANFKPKKLLILDIYENSAYDIQNELRMNYKDLDLFTIIASVRDKKRIRKIFKEYSPDVVFHAAAHKHVPLMEDNSEEAIKNNVVGTLNVCEVCDEFNVDKFVLISTDKAVNPTNIMGATKRLCEMIVQAMNKKSKTDYVAVRFGNVLVSNGSVIPLFKNQIKNGGPVTLTHKEIIRYFMLIPEAAQLVLQAGAFAKGGEIFILDMGEPVKIYDLAKKLIKLSGFEPEVDIKIEVTGLRPGEKLYEELLMNEEGLTETENNKIFIGVPSEFDINELKLKINDLLKVAVNEDKESLKVKMKEVVPTFKEPDEANSEKKIASLAI